MIKKKYSQLQDFKFHATAFMKNKEVATTKFEYALLKMKARVSTAQRPLDDIYNEDIQDIKRETAQEDEKGNLIIENNSYKWTREGKKNFDERVRARTRALNDTDVEVEPYICTGKIPDLSEYQVLAFKGLVIEQTYELPEPVESEQETTA